jgi:hypothetical protein
MTTVVVTAVIVLISVIMGYALGISRNRDE